MAEENKAMELHGEESEKKKYISDVLDIDKLIEEYGNKIMLIAGVGSGKSTWVKDVLTQKGNVLFITSRRAKVDEDIAHSCFTSFVREQDGQRENLITNAKLGYILINAHADMQMTVDNFLNCYEYIVVDEIHSMASDSTFARSSFDVLTFIEYAAEQGHKVIVMTGTPEPVQSYFQNNGWHIEDYRKICNYVKPEAIKYIYKEKRADVIKEALEENKKVIYFVNNTVTITETIREVLDKRIGEIEKIAVIVSDEKRKDMDAALKEKFPGYNEEINDQVYTSLIQNQVLPEECEILISTSRLKEGVDILNENACVICDNHILSNLIQFFGRVRVGGGTVYIIEDAQQHEIKHDKLLYEYAKQQEITAANKFVDTYIKEQEDVFEYGPTFSLIRFVEQNPYIRYNFIKKKFQLFEIKYNEEIRLLNIKDWKEELQDYCKEYGIKTPLLIPRYKMQGIIEEGFTKNLEPDKRFYGEDIERIKGIIRRNYGIKYTQIKKINESLEEQGVSFRIYSGKETSKEHTATDIDTVTDNFQSDMKNIQSAMESVTNGTFQNSDMADLIQQFPELSNASGDLKDNLQNLAMNKGAEAIGKIRDAVKDVTDPKQLAQADKYVQSIMDTMDSQSRIIILLRLHYIEIRLTIYRKNLVQKRL